MQSKLPKVWQVLRSPLRREMSMQKTETAIPLRHQIDHIYKKTYTQQEFINHLQKNVLYESKDYIATNVPQGVCFVSNKQWPDYDKPLACNATLQEMLPELCKTFNTETLYISKHPRRTSSGLLLLVKNPDAFETLKTPITEAVGRLERIYTYLVIVLGHPKEELNKTFTLVIHPEEGGFRHVEIFDKPVKKVKGRKIGYSHTVLGSTEHVSLLKVCISNDKKDSIRHILAQKYFTPILGDFWNLRCSQNTIFGAPVVVDPNISQKPSIFLHQDLMEKLQLSEGEEMFTPIHSHLYRIRLPINSRKELFFSAPVAESFVWTCQRLVIELKSGRRLSEVSNNRLGYLKYPSSCNNGGLIITAFGRPKKPKEVDGSKTKNDISAESARKPTTGKMGELREICASNRTDFILKI